MIDQTAPEIQLEQQEVDTARVPVGVNTRTLNELDESNSSVGFGMINAENTAVNPFGAIVYQQGAQCVYAENNALRNHVEYGKTQTSRRRGVRGAHLKDIFLRNDVQIVSTKPHPHIRGVEIIEYRMPKRDKTGTPIPGQYQAGDPQKNLCMIRMCSVRMNTSDEVLRQQTIVQYRIRMEFCQENGADTITKGFDGMVIIKMAKSHHFTQTKGGVYEKGIQN